MRLYGSVTNRIAESVKPPIPEIGMGATICMYTDRIAATVIEVSADKKRIVIQEDNATRTDKNGMSESQEYHYSPNPDGVKHEFSLRKNGRWVEAKDKMSSGSGLQLGERDHYYDFSF